MPRRLPPLTTLPAFDAAARHLSFTKAAAELNLTHGAISRAVRNLEERLGIRLFERGTRSVRLTPAGAAYAAEIGAALDRIGAATIVATAPRSAGVLTVSTSDGFAGRWLVPRLYRFHRENRDVDVRLSTSGVLADFIRDGIDIAIRYGAGGYEGVVSELLAEEEVSPVCSPELLKGEHPLRSPSDLKYHTLIHDNFRIDWATWLQHAGVDGINPNSGVSFDSATYAVEAAVHSEGVLLGRSALVSADLAAGRLVRPFGLALKSRSKYYVVYPDGALRQRKVKAFRDWLFSEMAAG
ncbi:MAG: transcriptional regulator GcvA [Mesorhizobium sp.]|uniref:transcriptional regulator GcvA n=1 Tax=unclassified Mesorhizobium TaxID=325217 RepID=UPI000FCA8A21|nr:MULTISPECIES: transcriptional regulator GcvA [unclassified Mesorhizobium]RUV70677.1 transcriptional regulator GcvA [Mesorhizobium sp. M5C.F.Cr.IN.023.01.1.1]RWF90082.1 MAG: transcriptional regulator GcvA [Mesorhizobium sp.]RWF92735.1 MAG: transcriptional regulator GcvA [Mesorhizobium sp.]RWI41862.1 MAG: transcriptional regulator GcvA [Mesorhizobium sp.]RWI51023.1 MAG: transcriptional regulator GcvA [Mesorhizobium sp.]